MDDIGPLLAQWPVDTVAAAVTTTTETVAGGGPLGWQTRIASVSKLFVAYACLVALEEGTLTLDEPAGPEGSTVRHLLAHASGLAFDKDRLWPGPGSGASTPTSGSRSWPSTWPCVPAWLRDVSGRGGRRTTGYVRHGPARVTGRGDRTAPSPTCLRFGRELLAPTLISGGNASADATRPHFPDA